MQLIVAAAGEGSRLCRVPRLQRFSCEKRYDQAVSLVITCLPSTDTTVSAFRRAILLHSPMAKGARHALIASCCTLLVPGCCRRLSRALHTKPWTNLSLYHDYSSDKHTTKSFLVLLTSTSAATTFDTLISFRGSAKSERQTFSACITGSAGA